MSARHDRERCRALAERLSEYLDGELPEELRREIETHFSACSTCDRFLDSLRRTKELAHLLPAIELPESDRDRLTREARARLDS